jgi:uncharacterized protein (TIGR03663 family)
MAEYALDRKLGRYTLEQVLYAVILLVALGVRLYLLDQKPQHHDESIHAFFSWKIVDAGLADYKYDPVYHGPILYYSTAFFLWILDSDFGSRLSCVAFGMGVLAFAWPLRRYLGRAGALCFLVLLSFSPSFVYFTRFLRHDIYVAFGCMMAIYYAFRYGETRSAPQLYLSAVGLAIAFCTKEDMYLLAPVFLFALFLTLVWEVLGARDRTTTVRRIRAEVAEFFGRAAIPLVTSAAIFVGIWVTFYSSFFTHWEKALAIDSAIRYWWGQHSIQRIGGPWWYYVPQLTLYDPLIFFPLFAVIVGRLQGGTFRDGFGRACYFATLILAGAFVIALLRFPEQAPLVLLAAEGAAMLSIATRWVPDRFTRFCILWALGALATYGWAQEKVPWLLVPMVLPLSLVAARYYADIVESGAIRSARALVPIGAIGALTLWTLVSVNYLYEAPIGDEPKDARHAELLVYVQSTFDVIKVVRRIEEVAEKLGTGDKTRLAVSGNATWPFSWYLRHYPVNWSADVRNVDTPVVIVDAELKSLDKPLEERYERETFEIRGWWEPDWRSLTPAKLFRWLFTRMSWNGNGSSDALLFVHRDLKPGTQFAAIPVDPPPAARGYPKIPDLLAPEAVWGTAGSGPGQFNEPRGLAIGQDGSVYVVDSKNNRLQKFSADGQHLHSWGREGSDPGDFKDPCGVAVGPDGNIYVADTWNHRIQKFDPQGTFLEQWHAEPGFWGPRGIVVAPDGRVFATDTGNKRVVSFSAEGKQLQAWGKEGSKPGEFIEPVGLAVDSAGRLAVADTGNRRLQFFDLEGKYVEDWRVFGWEEFYTEPYLSASGDQIYVSDSYGHRFARYAGSEKLTGQWGRSGTGRGDFNRPIGIAAAPDGAVYVADTMNNRVQKFRPPQ